MGDFNRVPELLQRTLKRFQEVLVVVDDEDAAAAGLGGALSPRCPCSRKSLLAGDLRAEGHTQHRPSFCCYRRLRIRDFGACSTGAERFSAQRAARTYSPGVTPAMRLKCRWSWLWS